MTVRLLTTTLVLAVTSIAAFPGLGAAAVVEGPSAGPGHTPTGPVQASHTPRAPAGANAHPSRLPAALRRAAREQADTAAATQSAGRDSLNLLEYMVDAYRGPLGPYSQGVWRTPNTVCWACNQGGPATASATVYMLTGRSKPALLNAAEGTIETAIQTRQRPDGAFSGPSGDEQSPSVSTMFFGVEEAYTYLELYPVLDPTQRITWRDSIAAAAQYLINNGNVTWYTNGNINIGNAELFYLAWRVTGEPRFASTFERAFAFTLHPPQAQWPGRGLVIVRRPRNPNGSDGAGYLTETGAGGTGFDPEYTELQLDVASRLYLLSGDPQVLRLANLLANMLLPRISSNFMLNTSLGSRHTEPDREVPLLTSAFAVLGLYGGRSELTPLILPELHETAAAYAQPYNDYGEVYRRALGSDLAVIALATNQSRPPLRAPEARLRRSSR